jgi:hypothetical protein
MRRAVDWRAVGGDVSVDMAVEGGDVNLRRT